MKIYLEIDSELAPAIQQHLEGGISVQDYIKASLLFFEELRKKEIEGNGVGYGRKESFDRYNTTVLPSSYIARFKDE